MSKFNKQLIKAYPNYDSSFNCAVKIENILFMVEKKAAIRYNDSYRRRLIMDKKAYQEKIEARLKEWQAEVDKLKAQAQGKSADAKIEYEKKVKELEKKMEQSKEKLEGLKKAGASTWEEAKKEVEKETNELKAQLRDILN